jgi:hypothetical protein
MLTRHIGERGRIIGITILITTLYLLLQQLWLGLGGLLFHSGFLERPSAAELEREAKEVAILSEKALQTAPTGSRHAIWQLGFHLGYVSQVVGSYAMSAEDVQAKARQAAEPALHEANSLAQTLGLGPVTPLATRTLDDFARLSQRIEADETGVGERITLKLSSHHHHLFLLGMHLGTEAARIQWSGGSLSLPPRAQIRRHATLAGIPRAAWEPLAVAPGYGEQPGEVIARYRDGLTALVATLSSATPAN